MLGFYLTSSAGLLMVSIHSMNAFLFSIEPAGWADSLNGHAPDHATNQSTMVDHKLAFWSLSILVYLMAALSINFCLETAIITL